MDSCCQNKATELSALMGRQRRVLWIVLAINAIMFATELSAGFFARSSSLKADSLDMLGDSIVYAFSLFVIARSARWRGTAALLKGVIMTAFGLGIIAEVISKIFLQTLPVPQTMGLIGVVALVANGICMMLLLRHRTDDINMRSTWICSRNDIIANACVLLAAWAVNATQTKWPDVIVGALIATLFLSSSVEVLRGAIKELKSQQQNA